MSQVLEVVADQEVFAVAEKEFDARYDAATQAEDAALRADVTASVKSHRLGTVAEQAATAD